MQTDGKPQSLRADLFAEWVKLRLSTRIAAVAICIALLVWAAPPMWKYGQFFTVPILWVLALLYARSAPVDRKLVKAAALVDLAIEKRHPAVYERVMTSLARRRQRSLSRRELKVAGLGLVGFLVLNAAFVAIWAPLVAEPKHQLPTGKLVDSLVALAGVYAILLAGANLVARSSDEERIRKALEGKVPAELLAPEAEQKRDPLAVDEVRRIEERFKAGDPTVLDDAKKMYDAAVIAAIENAIAERLGRQNWWIGFVFFLLGAAVSAILG